MASAVSHRMAYMGLWCRRDRLSVRLEGEGLRIVRLRLCLVGVVWVLGAGVSVGLSDAVRVVCVGRDGLDACSLPR